MPNSVCAAGSPGLTGTAALAGFMIKTFASTKNDARQERNRIEDDRARETWWILAWANAESHGF